MTNYAELEKRLRQRADDYEPGRDPFVLREAADAIAALTADLQHAREALAPFAECAKELEGSEDVPRAPEGEWAKFRLLTDDYRLAAAALARISK